MAVDELIRRLLDKFKDLNQQCSVAQDGPKQVRLNLARPLDWKPYEEVTRWMLALPGLESFDVDDKGLAWTLQLR